MIVANPDRRLLELLTPIFRGHAALIEALLPPKLQSNWRKAVAFAHQTKGRKAFDHRDLLLAMAELDADATRPPRELATAVLARFLVKPGKGYDPRSQVELPDGSSPARKDLLDRLVHQYDAERPALLQEIVAARRLDGQIRKQAEQDADATTPPGERAAATALTRFPVTRGAGHEAHSQIQPDGPEPAREDLPDLLDRLAREIGAENPALLQQIAALQLLVHQTRRLADKIAREGIKVLPPGTSREHGVAFVTKSSALSDTNRMPDVTAHQVDQVLKTAKELTKKS